MMGASERTANHGSLGHPPAAIRECIRCIVVDPGGCAVPASRRFVREGPGLWARLVVASHEVVDTVRGVSEV